MFVRSVDLLARLIRWLFALFIVLIAVVQLTWVWLAVSPERATLWVRTLTQERVMLSGLQVAGSWVQPRIRLERLYWRGDRLVAQAEGIALDLDLLSLPFRHGIWGQKLAVERLQVRWTGDDAPMTLARAFALLQNVREGVVVRMPFRQIHIRQGQWRQGPWRIVMPLLWLQGSGSTLTVQGQTALYYEDTLLWRHRLSGYLQLDRDRRLQKGRIGWRTDTPAALTRLAPLLQTRWQTGTLWLDGQLHWREGLPVLTLQADLRELNWAYVRDRVDSLGVTLQWQPGYRHQRFDITHWRINQYYLSSVSPASVHWLEANRLRIEMRQWTLAPFQPVLEALWPDWPWADTRLVLSRLNTVVRIRPFHIETLHGEVETLAWPSAERWPGIEAHGIMLETAADGPVVQVRDPVRVYWPALYDRTLKLQFEAPLRWTMAPGRWRLGIPAVRLEQVPIQLQVLLEEGVVRGGVTAQPGSLAAVKALLPYRVLSPALRQWLETALEAGRVPRVHAAFFWSAVTGVHALHGEAVLEAGRLRFHPDWPALEAIAARLQFSPERLEVIAEHAELAGVTLTGGRVEIGPLQGEGQKGLRAYGDVTATAEALETFLTGTPLADLLGVKGLLGQQVRLTDGRINAQLALWVPLSEGERRALNVDVQAMLDGVGLSGAGRPLLTGITGRVHVTQQSAVSAMLKARLLGTTPVTLRLETRTRTPRAIVLKAEGQLPLGQYVADATGRIGWQGQVQVPLEGDEGIRFSLRGAPERFEDHGLPAPLHVWLKQPFDLQGRYRNGRLRFSGYWGRNWLGARWQRITGRRARLQLRQATILINERYDIATRLLNRDEQNLLISGRVDTLPLHAWLAWWPKQKARLGIEGSATASLPLPLVLGVRAGAAAYHAQRFPNAALTAYSLDRERIGVELKAHNADAIAIWMPERRDLVLLAKKLHLQRVSGALAQSEAEAPPVCHPWARPQPMNIAFTGMDVRFDRYRFDRIVFKAYTDPAQARLENIMLEAAGGQVRGTGRMVWDYQQNRTELAVTLEATPIEALLDWAGWRESGFLGEKARLKGRIHWQGPPDCFQLSEIAGNVSVRFDDGVIQQARLGMAKLIGLLSVDSLLRNLKLTLSQLQYDGMVYDYISARASLGAGVATLTAFEMDAPVMRAELSGSLDYVNQLYDLTARVYPKVGGTLAAAATLLGWTNPLTAITTYLIVKGVTGDKAIQPYRYRIMGDWLSPTIINLDTGEVVRREPRQSETTGEDVLDILEVE